MKMKKSKILVLAALAAFLNRAARRGEVVTARTGRETLTGTFADIDATGALVLKTAKGPVAVAAADIYF